MINNQFLESQEVLPYNDIDEIGETAKAADTRSITIIYIYIELLSHHIIIIFISISIVLSIIC